MKRWIERALNVRPGDLGRGVLLCSCLFLVICSYKIGGVAGGALFLFPFPAQQLGYSPNFRFGVVSGGLRGIKKNKGGGFFPRFSCLRHGFFFPPLSGVLGASPFF